MNQKAKLKPKPRNFRVYRALAFGAVESVFFDAELLERALEKRLETNPENLSARRMSEALEAVFRLEKTIAIIGRGYTLNAILKRANNAKTKERLALRSVSKLDPTELETLWEIVAPFSPALNEKRVDLYDIAQRAREFLRTFGIAIEPKGTRNRSPNILLRKTRQNIKLAEPTFETLVSNIRPKDPEPEEPETPDPSSFPPLRVI